jgi:hypothetical protein
MIVKDTFISVFPDYGVRQDDNEESMSKTFYRWNKFNPIELKKTTDVSKEYFFKLDE